LSLQLGGVNKFNSFIGELDLFFYRRGAEGTEEEKKERDGVVVF